jgi:LemA protein
MPITLIIVIVVTALLYFWYASIISKRNNTLEALSGIDVQLKKRSELIPNILRIAKTFMEHETELFNQITSLREQAEKSYDKTDAAQVQSHLAAATQLSDKVGNLMIRAEAYPTLKSDATMVQAQQTYNEVEEQLAAARRFYNSAVDSLRNTTQIFPGNVIAKIVGVGEMPFFATDEASKKDINADDYLK